MFFFFFLIYVGCPGQLTRTTTIPHGPLYILQAQEQVRHRGGDRRAHRGSNPERGRNKSHGWPQQLDPQVQLFSPVTGRFSIIAVQVMRNYLTSMLIYHLLFVCDCCWESSDIFVLHFCIWLNNYLCPNFKEMNGISRINMKSQAQNKWPSGEKKNSLSNKFLWTH